MNIAELELKRELEACMCRQKLALENMKMLTKQAHEVRRRFELEIPRRAKIANILYVLSALAVLSVIIGIALLT